MGTLKNKLVLGSLLLITTFTSSVYALPMFERQTGLSCNACHSQQEPKLGRLGRDFLLSGMTLSDKVGMEDGKDADIQASIMFKSRYEKRDNSPNSKGEISTESPLNDGSSAIPKTLAVSLGGRINESFGTLINASYKDNEDHALSGRVVYSKSIDDGYTGFAVYSYADFGPFSGIELYNTGLYKPLRTFESMKLSNINQAAKIGTGSATGVQAFYAKDVVFSGSDRFFATIGAYTPTQDNADMSLSENFIPMARIAYEYQIGNFNYILGGYALVGGKTSENTQRLTMERETYGIDFQIEGMIVNKEVSLVATKVLKNDVNFSGLGSGDEDFEDILSTGYSIETHVNLTQEFGAKLAYLEYDDKYTYSKVLENDVKDLDNVITLGIDYVFKIGTPMKIALEHSWAKPTLDRVEDYNSFVATLNISF